MKLRHVLGFVAVVCSLTMLVGCSEEQPADNASATSGAANTNVVVDDHSGWWCTPHGIPEEECSMCSASYAKECKEKGDWCDEHNRAKSQCFKCDPTLAEKYAKLYEAKYGEAPPPITD